MADFPLPSEDASRTPDAFAAPPPGQVHVAPLDVDGVRTVEVGTILWGLAFVALLPFYSSLEEAGKLWWLWTCAAGLGFGLLGIEYCRRRRDRALDAGRTAELPALTQQQATPPRARAAERRSRSTSERSARPAPEGRRAGGRRRLE